MSLVDITKEMLEKSFQDSVVETFDITGGHGSFHLGVLVASDTFIGKMLLEQHRMVMDVLTEKLKEEVHAVKIKTMTLEKYKTLKNKES